MIVILEFIGCGSAFNPQLGNTSAYIEDGKRFVLLDCGESVYARLFELGIFEQYGLHIPMQIMWEVFRP